MAWIISDSMTRTKFGHLTSTLEGPLSVPIHYPSGKILYPSVIRSVQYSCGFPNPWRVLINFETILRLEWNRSWKLSLNNINLIATLPFWPVNHEPAPALILIHERWCSIVSVHETFHIKWSAGVPTAESRSLCREPMGVEQDGNFCPMSQRTKMGCRSFAVRR